MAKLSVTLRNKKRIRMAAHFEPIRQELRKKAISTTISEEERDAARIKLQTLPRNGSKTRIRNRCLATGRSRGIYRKFMLSRICFREMAHQGLVPGVTKASW